MRPNERARWREQAAVLLVAIGTELARTWGFHLVGPPAAHRPGGTDVPSRSGRRLPPRGGRAGRPGPRP